MKRLNSYAVFQILIILAAYTGCWVERGEIAELIDHNRSINSIIVLLFAVSSLYVLGDTINSICNGYLWRRHKDNLSEYIALKIFGRKFYRINDTSDDTQNEIILLWKNAIEWKSNVLDYISGTLIGVGLLGTFIGLMHTMGSVFSVLSNGVSGKDLVSELGVPLAGMSTAFSASMMGLSTSLTIGLLGVLTAKINKEFVSEVENWSIGLKDSKEEGGDNYNHGKQYLKKVLLHVEENNNLVKANNECLSAIIHLLGNHQTCVTDLSQAISVVSDNTSYGNEMLNNLNSLLAESESKTEVVRIHLESIIKSSIQDNYDHKKSWRDIEQGMIAIKSLLENNDNDINKFKKIQEVMYESGFVCLNEVVSVRRLLESAFMKENSHTPGEDA